MIQQIGKKSLFTNLNHNGGCGDTFIIIKIPNFLSSLSLALEKNIRKSKNLKIFKLVVAAVALRG